MPLARRYARTSGYKRARMAANAASYVYRNRGKFKWAAKKIQSRWKRRKLNSRVTGSKTSTTQYGTIKPVSNVQVSQLQVDKINMAPNDAESSFGRWKPNMRLRGIKVCEYFLNTNPYPVEIHYAVLQLKSNGRNEPLADTNLDFFRDTTNAMSRAYSFPPVGTAYDMKLSCFGINPDKFNILSHKRRILGRKTDGPSGLDQGWRESGWMWRHHQWFGIKKRVSFESPTTEFPERAYLTCWWWQPLNWNDWNGLATGVEHRCLHRVYMRD